jgi:hypothetical protein
MQGICTCEKAPTGVVLLGADRIWIVDRLVAVEHVEDQMLSGLVKVSYVRRPSRGCLQVAHS